MTFISEIQISKLTTIKVKTDESFKKCDFVLLKDEEENIEYRFKVLSVLVNNRGFEIVCYDIGYYKSLNKLDTHYLKKFIGLSVYKVIDKEKIDALDEESRYI